MSPDIEKYLRIRLAELDDEHGDHSEYGIVFGIINVSEEDARLALDEDYLEVKPGIYSASWHDNGVVNYDELVTAQDYANALEGLRFLKEDYREFCNTIDSDEV